MTRVVDQRTVADDARDGTDIFGTPLEPAEELPGREVRPQENTTEGSADSSGGQLTLDWAA